MRELAVEASRRGSVWPALLASATLGCSAFSHSAAIRPLASSGLEVTSVRGQRVAVVVDPAAVKLAYDVSGNGHSFHLRNVRPTLELALATALQPASEVVFFSQDPGPGFDVYVYPRVELDFTMSGLLSAGIARSQLSIRDSRGQAVGDGRSEKQASFLVILTFVDVYGELVRETLADATATAFRVARGGLGGAR